MITDDKQYHIEDLLFVLRRLRAEQGGCAWAARQTPDSLKKYAIEEVYELLDAIEGGDADEYCDELGDVLLQVVFHSEIGQESGYFNFADVVNGLVHKMLQRNPHVFIDGQLDKYRNEDMPALNLQQIEQNWHAIKQKQQIKTHSSVLDGVSSSVPALMQAQKLQSKAATTGFDWPKLNDVVDKLDEEVAEFKAAMEDNDAAAIADELGDILFTAVNIACHKGLDAETLLRNANRKFANRFKYVEAQQKLISGNAELELLDQFWQQAKLLEK